MDLIYSLYSSIFLLLLFIILLIKKYEISTLLLHPGLFFSIVWIVSAFSVIVLFDFEIFIYDKESLSILYKLISFCAISFIIGLFVYAPKKNIQIVRKGNQKVINYKRVKIFLYITFMAAIVHLINLFNKSFITTNLAEVRSIYADGNQQMYFQENWEKLISYLLVFKEFVYLFMGYLLGDIYLKGFIYKVPLVDKLIFFSLPFLGLLSDGGRNHILLFFIYSFIGFAFSFFENKSISRKKIYKFFLSIFFVLLLFVFFVNANRIARAEYVGAELKGYENINLYGFEGVVDYMIAHNYGFQLRINDTFNPDNLSYGISTFNGILKIKIPFSELLGIKDILSYFFNLTNPLDYFVLMQENKTFYYTTHSAFAQLMCDFDFIGSCFILFLLILITQKLFVIIISRKFQNLNSISILIYFLFFKFWVFSTFQSAFQQPLVLYFLAGFIFFNIVYHKPSTYKYLHK